MSIPESRVAVYPPLQYAMQTLDFIIPVKYLKEVTPYFRKASLLAELGWDLQKEYMGIASEDSLQQVVNGEKDHVGPLPGPPPDSSYSRSDTRCVPLTLALLATNFKHMDPGKS